MKALLRIENRQKRIGKNKQGVKIRISISRYILGVQSSAAVRNNYQNKNKSKTLD